MARFSMEMPSKDGSWPNVLRVYEHNGEIFVEVEATHGGHKVTSAVRLEKSAFLYNLRASGILS